MKMKMGFENGIGFGEAVSCWGWIGWGLISLYSVCSYLERFVGDVGAPPTNMTIT